MELHRLLGELYRDTDDPSVQEDITEFLSAAALESDNRDIVNSATHQLILIKNLEAGNNQFSRDVLVRILASPTVATLLSSEVRAAAACLLESWEAEPGALRGTSKLRSV